MADPTAIVPYNDPFYDELHTFENFLMYNDDYPTLALTELPRPICSTSHFVPPTGNDDDDSDDDGLIADPNHPCSDPFFWNLYASTQNSESAQAGPSRIHDEPHGRDGGGTSNVHNANVESPIQLSVWPPPNTPYICSCCQVLREITHTNGNDVTKLEIHGRLGLICHAIHEKYNVDSSSNQNHEYQMFDFCKESIGNVKQFLVQYCEERKRSGYIMLQDPLSIFYEALCVGLDWDDNIDTDDFVQPSPTSSGDMQISPIEAINQTEEESNRARATRSTLSAQRERTGKLTLKDFIKYFNMPIESAAKKVRICPTVMKKICRKHGLTRWPHRKIKSIERKIARKAQFITSEDVQERAQAQADVERLQQEIANIYARFGG